MTFKVYAIDGIVPVVDPAAFVHPSAVLIGDVIVGPRCYVGLTETTTGGGYRVYDHVKRLLNGPLVWTPGIDGAIVLSVRGGDFELTVGEDLSIGYLNHTADKVRLYLQESLTFRVITAEAAIPLRYRNSKAELAPPARGTAKKRASR